MDNNRQIYRDLCNSIYIPLQAQYWWFNATCHSEDWDVILVYKGTKIIAALPYQIKSKIGVKINTNAPIAGYTFIYINYPLNAKNHTRLSLERNSIHDLGKILAKKSITLLNLHPLNKNHLPLKWLGFSQTTRYTYLLDLTPSLESIRQQFKHNIVKNIKKAATHFSYIKINELSIVVELLQKLYASQNLSLPYSEKSINLLDIELKNRDARVIFGAKNEQDKIVAAVYFAYDKRYATCLYTASDKSNRNNGVISGLYWEAIQFFKEKDIPILDFDGSILSNVEPTFAAFGAQQTPYHQIYKAKNKFIHTLLLWLGKI